MIVLSRVSPQGEEKEYNLRESWQINQGLPKVINNNDELAENEFRTHLKI